MPKKGMHVVPNDGGWSVRRAGASRASVVCSTQEEAVEKAKKMARHDKTELYIHGRDENVIPMGEIHTHRKDKGCQPFRSKNAFSSIARLIKSMSQSYKRYYFA